MRWVKISARIIGGFLGLVVLAAGTVWFGGAPAAIWAIEHPLSRMLGRQIEVGSLAIDWGAPSRIIIEDVHVANADWGTEKEMFSARRLEIALFARSLLWGPVRVPLVGFDGAKLLLETSDHGERNWDFGLKSAAPQKRGQFPDLEKLTAHESEFRYRNGETKAESGLGIKQMEIDAPDPQSPVKIAAEGSFQDRPLQLAATVGPLSALRDTAQPYPVKLDGALENIHVVADGSLKEPLDFDGVDLRLSLDGSGLADLASLLGVPFPEVPPFRSTAKLIGGKGIWELQALSLALGKSNLQGGIAIDTTSKVPQLKANLTSSAIDLADFKGVYGGKPGHSAGPTPPDPSGRVLPNTPIDVHKFPGINADVSFDATRIIATGGLPIERVSLGLQLRDGTLNVKPLRFHVAKGDVDLNMSFTPFTNDGPPHLKADIDIRHVDLHGLLGGPGMPDIVRQAAGNAGGFVKVDTRGVSTREFLAHMSGDAGLFIENGQLSQLMEQLAPIDVLGALGVYVRGDKPVPINCFVSRFDIKTGLASISTLLVDTPEDDIVGKGSINFADETLDLSLTPSNKGFTIVSLRTPVDIDGTFHKPDYHLKAGGLLARLGAAVGLGILFPPAALLPLIDTGLGENNACSKAYAAQNPPGSAAPTSGSGTPKSK
jgi:uncharacterized protein involved in outer membrane biogenesis